MVKKRGKQSKKQASKKRPPASRSIPAGPTTTRPPARGLKIHKAPDVVALSGLRQEFGVPDALMSPREQSLRSLIEVPDTAQLSVLAVDDEERALVRARAAAQKLIKEDERLRTALAAVLFFRRSYAVAYREIQEALALYPEAPPMTEDYLIQSAMHAAAQPFNEHELMQSVVDAVIPWLASIVDKHTAEDEESTLCGMLTEEEARLARRVPIGFLLDLDSTEPALSRAQSLVLAGPANAVAFVLDQIVNAALCPDGDTCCVVRFCEQAPRSQADNRRLVRVSPDHWAGCGNKSNGVAVVMGSHVQDQLVQPPDLVVCDNLALAYTGGFIGRPAPASAGDAHKVFRKWCDLGQALFVAGLPLEEDDLPDLRHPAYEQLRTFTLLRAVHVLTEATGLAEGQVRVNVVGSLHDWDVDKEVLAGYGHGRLILPPS